MMSMPRWWACVLAAAVLGCLAATQAAAAAAHVEFQGPATVTVKPGQTAPVSLTFHVLGGYHINSSRPLKSYLIPARLSFTPSPHLAVAVTQYPVGAMMSLPFQSTTKFSLYAGDVVVKATLSAKPGTPPGAYRVQGAFTYQPSDNNAMFTPERVPVQIEVTVRN